MQWMGDSFPRVANPQMLHCADVMGEKGHHFGQKILLELAKEDPVAAADQVFQLIVPCFKCPA